MISKDRAAQIIESAGIEPGTDYFALRGSQLDGIQACPEFRVYRHRKDAPGCKVRMFYEYLTRRAK